MSTLDYVIASHYDEDHINGIVGAIYAFEIGTVIAPDYIAGTDIYRSLMSALEMKNLSITYPVVGTSYALGNSSFTILGPIDPYAEEENDRSVVIRFEEDGCSILLTGDAGKESEYAMTLAEKIQSDLLVVGHHGSAHSTSQIFLDAVKLEGAIISCGKNNPYGHPTADVLSRLQGIPLYRTDKQGDMVFYVEGGEWKGPDPCNDYSPGWEESYPPTASPDTGQLQKIVIPGEGELKRIEIPDDNPGSGEAEGRLQRIVIPNQ